MTQTADLAGRLQNRAGNRLLKMLPGRRSAAEGQSWLIVYLDIITLMLAMFILLVNDPRQGPVDIEAAVHEPAPPAITEQAPPVEPVAEEPATTEVLTPEPSLSASGETTQFEPEHTIEEPLEAELPVVARQSIEMLEPVDLSQWQMADIQTETPTEPQPENAGLPETEPVAHRSEAEKILLELKSIDGEELVVDIKAGEINLQLPESILFETGKTDLLPDAIELLKKIVPVVAENPYPLSIEGHTDDVPIQTSQYPSNWELSAARATVVLRKLAELGIDYKRMKAIGYADTSPISDNDSEQGRSKNRRVSIIIHAAQP